MKICGGYTAAATETGIRYLNMHEDMWWLHTCCHGNWHQILKHARRHMVVTHLLPRKMAPDIQTLCKCLILKNLKGKAFLQQVMKTQGGNGMSMADWSTYMPAALYTTGDSLVLISVRGEVDPRGY
jgi:hypothetical protein